MHQKIRLNNWSSRQTFKVVLFLPARYILAAFSVFFRYVGDTFATRAHRHWPTSCHWGNLIVPCVTARSVTQFNVSLFRGWRIIPVWVKTRTESWLNTCTLFRLQYIHCVWKVQKCMSTSECCKLFLHNISIKTADYSTSIFSSSLLAFLRTILLWCREISSSWMEWRMEDEGWRMKDGGWREGGREGGRERANLSVFWCRPQCHLHLVAGRKLDIWDLSRRGALQHTVQDHGLPGVVPLLVHRPGRPLLVGSPTLEVLGYRSCL